MKYIVKILIICLIAIDVYASKVVLKHPTEIQKVDKVMACSTFTLPAGPLSFCYGDSLELDAGSAVASRLWSNGKTTQKITLKAANITGSQDTIIVRSTVAGCTTVADTVLVILNSKPNASFTSVAGCINKSLNFTNTSSISPVETLTHKWTFSVDNSNQTTTNATKTFSSLGTSTITLIETSTNGCKDTASQSITIKNNPVADFVPFPVACKGLLVQYDDTSTIVPSTDTISYAWKFSVDNSTSTSRHPQVSYNTVGTYKATLIVTSKHGCVDSISRNTVVKDLPVANFSPSITEGCRGAQVTFTNTSTVANDSITMSDWSYGDATYDSLRHQNSLNAVSKTFSEIDSYNVQLIVHSKSGCKSVIAKDFIVNPAPTPQFSYSNLSVAVPSFFNNTSTISTTDTISSKWYFGESNATSSLFNSQYQYTTSGNKTVKLVATSEKGCKDSVSNTISIAAIPVADFKDSVANNCLNSLRYFVNKSTINPGTLTYRWDFGDGTSTTDANPLKTYMAPGDYTVTLIAIESQGGRDTITKNITVSPVPFANFTISNACLNSSASFNNLTSITSGTFSSSWNFGDAGTSSSLNPTHTYTSSGNKTVLLTVTSDQGCIDTISYPITVTVAPVASFTMTNQCFGENHTIVNNSSILGGGSLTYSWDFDDNGSSTSTDNTPNYTFLSGGKHHVVLTAISSGGCTDTVGRDVNVYLQPVSDFSFNAKLNTDTVYFTNSSTVGSGTLAYDWKIGTAGTSTLENPKYVFPKPSGYSVTLKVTTDKNCVASVSKMVNYVGPGEVSKTPPVVDTAGFYINGSKMYVKPNTQLYVDGTIYNDTLKFLGVTRLGEIANFDSIFFAGNINNRIKKPLFVSEGVGTVIARYGFLQYIRNDTVNFNSLVINKFQQKLTLQRGITINQELNLIKGTVDFVHYNIDLLDTGYVKNETFDNYLKGDKGWIIARDRLIEPSVTTDVSSLGILLKPQQDNLGLTSFYRRNDIQDSLSEGSVARLFDVVPSSSGETDVKFNYFDNEWQGLSIPQNEVAFKLWKSDEIGVDEAGTWVQDTSSKVDVTLNYVTSKNVLINSTGNRLSVASFECGTPPTLTIPDTTVWFCDGDSLILDAGKSAVSLLWSTGATTQTIKLKKADISGTQDTIKVIGYNIKGCKAEKSVVVRVNPKPVAKFGTKVSACQNAPVLFMDSSSISLSQTLKYKWYFADTTTSTIQNPSKSFSSLGNKTNKLVVSSQYGCKDSVSKVVLINQLPKADFSLSSNAKCINQPVTLTNQSYLTAGNIGAGLFKSEWNFNDGFTSTKQGAQVVDDEMKAYSKVGTYYITLKVTSSGNCADSVKKVFTVNPNPVVAFEVGAVITNKPVSFTNNSTISSYQPLNYTWNFGDGVGTSNTINPTYTYTTTDSFTVKLVAESQQGCKDSISQVIKTSSTPVAAFNYNASSYCTGGIIDFTNQSTVDGGTMTYLWNFGDGTTNTSLNPSKQYSIAGTYTVSLTATGISGLSNTVTKVITINPIPYASFSATNVCVGSVTSFTNNSTISSGTLTYSWDLDQAQTSTAQAPTITYSSFGTYNTSLIVSSAFGCKDTATQSVIVNPNPTADFTPQNVCLGNSTLLTNNSTGTNTYLWNLGDGTTSTEINPLFNYAAAGSYSVTLNATTNKGCKKQATKSLTVYPLPVPKFTSSTACNKDTTYFTNQSSIASGTMTYVWNYGNGDSSTTNNAKYIFPNASLYNVELKAVSDQNCIAKITGSVIVRPLPTAKFTASTTCLGQSTQFTNQSSIATISTEAALTYTWTFGNGKQSVTPNPSVNYANAGTYSVSLLAESIYGCVGKTTNQVLVSTAPNPSFTATSACAGTPIVFTNSSSSTDGSTTTYSWNFNDGTSSTDSLPTKTFAIAKNYNIDLTATSSAGCAKTYSQSVSVYPNPNVIFTLPAKACENESVSIANTSSIASGTLTYAWDFGDASNSVLTSPNKTFTTAGNYVVSLTATSNQSCTKTLKDTIVINPLPVADFSIQTIQGGLGFTNLSTVSDLSPLTYLWNFGDGNTNTTTSPNHQYLSQGTYNVKLTATSGNGCKATATKSTQYPYNDLVDFYYSKINCEGSAIQFTDSSEFSSTNLSYLWDFGDGNTSTLKNPSNTFASAKTYQVSLTVTPNGGTAVNKTISLIVNPKPVLDFSVNSICEGAMATFNNLSTLANSYSWSFGNGNTDTLTNPTQTYAKSGTFQVSLQASNNNSCQSSITKSLQVYAYPKVNIGDTINTCAASFTLDAKNSGSTFVWSTSETTNSISANTDGKYAVTVTNGGICSTKDSVIVFLNNTSKISLGADRSLCYDEEIDAGPTGVSYLWNDGSTDRFLKIKASGTYFVKVLDFGNCNAYDTINITLKSGQPVNLGNDTTFCSSTKNLLLDATQTNGTYLWNNGETTAQKTIYASGLYGVTVSYPDGCKVYDEINVTINQTPTVNLGTDKTVCTSQSPVTLNAGGTGLTYLWSTTETASSIAVSSSGTYNVSVKNAANCEALDTIKVTINTSPTVNLGNDTLICSGNDLTLTAGNSSNTYLWSNGFATQQITVSKGGNYSVQVTNSFGCKANDAILVTEQSITKPNLGSDIQLCASQVPYTFAPSGNYSSYVWSNGPVTKSNSVSTSGLYILTVKDASNCEASDSVQFTVNAMPVVSLGNDTSFCEGGSILMNAGNAGSSYLWSNAEVSQSIIASKGGTYSVEVTSPSGCKASDEKVLVSYFSPKVNIGSDQIKCEGESITLNAGNTGANFEWSTTETTQSITLTKTGKYSVKVTDANNCSASASMNATFETVPTPSLGNDKFSCSAINLDAGNDAPSILWSNGDTTRQTTVKKSGTYTVLFQSQAKCTSSDTVLVTIYAAPKVNLGKDTIICDNANLLLSAGNPGSSFVWNDLSNSSSLLVKNAGTYFVKVTDLNNCKSSDTIVVTTKSATAFSLGNDQDLCIGSSVTLVGPAAAKNDKYEWSDGSTSQFFTTSQSGTYYLNFTNSYQCTSYDTVVINMRSYPVVNLGKDTSMCGSKTLSVGSSNLKNTILWSDNSTGNQLIANTSGTYSVSVKNQYNCQTSDTINLVVYQKPTLSLGNDRNACNGDTVVLNPTTNSSSLLWSGGQTSSNLQVTKSGNYSVIAKTKEGCSQSDTVKVTFYKLPVLNFNSEYVICANTPVTLDATNQGSTYQWTSNKGINTSAEKIVVKNADTIYVKVQNSDACVARDTVKVTMSDKTVYANFLSVANVTVGDTVQFINMSYPAPFTSKWNFGDDITSSSETDPIHRYLVSGDITATLTVTNGTCSDTKKKVLKLARKGGSSIADTLQNHDIFVSAKVYPNPNEGRFLFEAELIADMEMDIDMYDMSGKVIFSYSKSPNKFQHIVVDNLEMQSGVYILRAVVRDQVKVFRVVVSK